MLASTDAGMINRDTITDIRNWSLPDTAFEFMELNTSQVTDSIHRTHS